MTKIAREVSLVVIDWPCVFYVEISTLYNCVRKLVSRYDSGTPITGIKDHRYSNSGPYNCVRKLASRYIRFWYFDSGNERS